MEKIIIILAAVVAVSEVLGLFSWFKKSSILGYVVKFLKLILEACKELFKKKNDEHN
jgi:hypothetical protein